MQKITCHDCGKALERGAEYMPYEVNGETMAKCRACHEVKPELSDFQKTETYTRVVGYIRPVEQWNKGKQQEYADRLEYTPSVA
ncbi:MAG: anaerobic ribonucleoside-triphosphate reductase [Candidatus Moraniibacteriota bacterium]